MKLSLSLLFLSLADAGRTTPQDLLARGYEYSLEQLMDEFSLSYEPEEIDLRRDVLKANLAKIRAHNSRTDSSYKMGVNQFAAMTVEEFKDHYKGYTRFHSPQDEAEELDSIEVVATSELPSSLDWREKNVVTPAKNQGGCGSCWAFSATETIESNVAINTGKLLTLAPQEFVSCAPNPNKCGGTGGCEGSTQWLAFNYSLTAGLAAESTYPYYGSDTKCDEAKTTPAVTISGYKRIPKNNYTLLMNAVATVGPVAISAAAEPWQLYDSGIFDDDCGADVDHAIQLVGYGNGTSGIIHKTAKDYWLVRNSWGASWGEHGYIRIERFGETAAGEPCYTDKTPQDGTECAGGPKTEQVCGKCGLMSDSSYVTGGAIKQ